MFKGRSLLLVGALTVPASAAQSATPGGEIDIAIRGNLVLTGEPIPANSQDQINQYINGYPVRGTSTTTANAKLGLGHNDSTMDIRLDFNGQAFSRTVTDGGRAQIYANATSSIAAIAGLSLNINGFFQFQPRVSCVTNSQITGVSGGPLVRRIAMRRALANKASAEQASSRACEARVASRLTQRIGEMLKGPNEMLKTRLFPRLRALGLMPAAIHSRSTKDWLVVGATYGARPDRPALPSGFDLVSMVHADFISTVTEKTLAGRTIEDQQLADTVEILYGEIPRELRIQAHRPRWRFQFAETDPVSITWGEPTAGGDADFNVTLRLQRVEADGESGSTSTVEAPITISATYDISTLPTGPKFTRHGPILIGYVDVPDAATAELVQTKFDALLGPELYLDGMTIPAGLGTGQLTLDNLRKLKFAYINPEGSWLQFAWKLPTE